MAQQDAYGQQVFGSGELDLNLDTVRARVLDMYRTLEQLLQDLQQHGGAWGPMLDRLSVVNVQHMAVLQQLRPLTKQFVLHPKAPEPPALLAAHAAEIPMLLASKVLPEQEATDSALLAALAAGSGDGGEPSTRLASDALAQAEDALGHLRRAVSYLVTATLGDDSSGVLDPKQSALRRAVDAASRDIQRAVGAQQAARAVAAAGGGRKRARDGSDARAAVPVGGQAAAEAARGAGADPAQQQMDALLDGVISGATLQTAK